MAFEVFDDVAFYWFLMSVLITFLAPATCIMVNKRMNTKRAQRCDWTADLLSCKEKNAALGKKKQRDQVNSLFSVQAFLFWGGWLVFIYLLTQITAKQGLEMASFDPFKILEIEGDAEPADVKKAYRKLSLIFHPDKNPGNKEAEQKFILIAKAYEVLTDEKTRENYEKYGNPDGYHGTSVTIGLPSFLTAKENELGILVVYFVVLIVVIPLVVGLWWRKSSKYLEDGIMQQTAFRFWKQLQENTAPKYLPGILASALEFQELVPRKNSQAADLDRLFKEVQEHFVKNQGDQVPDILKVKTMLYAFMLRVPIPASLQEDMQIILEQVPVLLQGMLNISIDQRFVTCTCNILDFQQLLTQAIWFHDSSPVLRQLPHISDRQFRVLSKSKVVVNSVAQLKELESEKRADILRDLPPAEAEDANKVIDHIADVEVDVKWEVEDEEGMYENDVINLIVRVDRKHYPDDYTRIADEEEKNDPILNKPERTEEEIDEILSKVEDEEARAEKREELLEEDRELWFAKQERKREIARARVRGGAGWFSTGAPPRVVHAPRYPVEVTESWIVMLVDTKTNRLIHHTKLATFNAVETITLKFVAPPAGIYQYEVLVKNNAYVGGDKKVPFKMQIEKRPEEEVLAAEAAEAE
eukprot:CAMPEP_0206042308 /NCGR_PEP_ID=MMETSP1466-20131121/6479_1 /ASSEMBLY_ACC=CAM_ASM_001126 /TAXON_ID=44452 /ORGANISM="Pavlova gyrans, Strain CCMP608" /LENGTH=640 /DNA_ID=CAMNT_0053417019 /DNA_START=54 /DNA_END=1973 /DNA_ORIENTATION=-